MASLMLILAGDIFFLFSARNETQRRSTSSLLLKTVSLDYAKLEFYWFSDPSDMYEPLYHACPTYIASVGVSEKI